MAADLEAFDAWPGGSPIGEDEGYNAVMTRIPAGEALLSQAVASGALVLGRAIDEDDFEDFQPHQSRKRRAVWARLAGQRAAGKVAPLALDLGIEALARGNAWHANLDEVCAGVDERVHERGCRLGQRIACGDEGDQASAVFCFQFGEADVDAIHSTIPSLAAIVCTSLSPRPDRLQSTS